MSVISVLMPTYNEEENVQAIYEAVRDQFINNLPKYDYEIVFIDNCSKDHTRDIIEKICEDDHRVKAIFNLKNFGQFNSPYYGLLQTTGDCTIMMASDFQDPPELIPQYVRKWEEGYRLVIAQKKKSMENPLIYWARGIYYKLMKKMSNVEMIEQFTGTGLYDRSFIQVLRDLKDPTPFIRGIVAELGPEYAVVPFVQPKRKGGRSSNNFFSLFDAAMLSFTSYTKAGMRIATFFGLGIAGISFLIGLLFLIMKLCFWDRFVMGYAPMVISIFFMGGVILTFMGLLGEYVMAMNVRIMNRPLVVEEKRINFEKTEG